MVTELGPAGMVAATVVGGLLDSINPCAIGVLVFLCTYLVSKFKTKRKLLINGTLYILAVFMTYLLAGIFLLDIAQKLQNLSLTVYIWLGGIFVVAGLLEIKDYFWYGKGPSLAIAPSEAKRIKKYAGKIGDSPWTAIGLGFFVAIVELPCTGAPYLAVLALMSANGGLNAFNAGLLGLYNFLFVLPLIIIVYSVYAGVSTEKFNKWQKTHKATIRLITGIVLIIFGAWMIFSVV